MVHPGRAERTSYNWRRQVKHKGCCSSRNVDVLQPIIGTDGLCIAAVDGDGALAHPCGNANEIRKWLRGIDRCGELIAEWIVGVNRDSNHVFCDNMSIEGSV